MKIDIQDIAEVLKARAFPAPVITEIMDQLQTKAEDSKADRETGTKAKNQLVIIASDPEGTLKGKELVGWVVQMAEEESPATALDRLNLAVQAFNQSKKGRRHPVASVGEAMENVARKYLKEQGLTVKTKTATYILPTDNRLREPRTA